MATKISGTSGVEFPDGKTQSRSADDRPAFHVHKNGVNQNIPASTVTVVTYNTKTFDTANAFDTTTGRFNPKIAGYYLIISYASIGGHATNNNVSMASIYKNGVEYLRGLQFNDLTASHKGLSTQALVYLDGVNDYVDHRVWINVAAILDAGYQTTTFTGYLVRAA